MVMNVSVENIPSYSIAYIRSVGPYGASNAKAMEQLKKWAAENKLLDDDAVILGIARDNPATTIPENCRFDSCIIVPGDDSFDGSDVRQGSIAGGKYAVFKIEHTAAVIQQAWAQIFPEISKRGWQFDEARPILERYSVKLVQDHECEICVPIL